MRPLTTFFAVTALACLACAVQTNTVFESLSVTASNDVAPSTPYGSVPKRIVETTNLNMEAAQ